MSEHPSGLVAPRDANGALLPGVLQILVVCTGNLCRSPMAERLLRDSLVRRVGHDARWVQVTSAGTRAVVGSGMEPDAVRTLAGRGIDGAEDFRARQLTAQIVQGADLIVTAERAHRAFVVDLVPGAQRRAFTLRELDRLLAAVDATALPTGTPQERGQAIAGAATAMRGLVPYVEAHEDDIVDPLARPLIEFERVAAELARVIDRPLDMLTGVRP